MAEMIQSGTTAFLEPMLSSSAGFDRIAKAVEETGIRACLGGRSDPLAGLVDARDAQTKDMSIASAVDAHSQYQGHYNDRLHVWMATETPRGADEAGFVAIGAAWSEHGIRLTMHLAEAPKDLKLIRESSTRRETQALAGNLGVSRLARRPTL
ncbi:hypothetical protein ACJZ2D_011830 [Fusarium nematophilum]